MKPLRIEVVGSHSVGKSVLVRHIAKAYELPILDEIARIEIAKMGGGFDKLPTASAKTYRRLDDAAD